MTLKMKRSKIIEDQRLDKKKVIDRSIDETDDSDEVRA